MATELTSVLLTGTYRNHEAMALFKRTVGSKGRSSWQLTATVGGVSASCIIDYREKPCWTVACGYMEMICPAKERAQKTPELPTEFEPGMVLKFAQ